MRRIDRPYVVSVVIGAILGVSLFVSLAPRLKSTPAPSSEMPRLGVAGRPTTVEIEGRLPRRPRAIVLGTNAPAQTRQNPPRPEKLERQASPARPASPPKPSGRASPPKPQGPAAQPAPSPGSPDRVIAQTPVQPEEQDLRFVVLVGPISDPDHAEAIIRQLGLAGYHARVTTQNEARPPHFQVISETVPQHVAERRMSALIQLGFRPQVRSLAGGFAQLRFGSFASQTEAELLARRIRTTGYAYAAVVREGGTVYTISTGPHTQVSVDAITATLRTRFRFMLPVTVTPAE